MTDEEIYRNDARRALGKLDVLDTKTDKLQTLISSELWRFREPYNRALFLDEALHFVQSNYDKHLLICTVGPTCLINQGMESALAFVRQEIAALPSPRAEVAAEVPLPKSSDLESALLRRLHPTVQSVAGKLFADGYYRQAIHDTYIALDNAVQSKSQRPQWNGAAMMDKVFSPNNPILKISDNTDEQQGFMTLFKGAILAIRNPKSHSLGGTQDAQRALEWLSFASVLLRNLDEAVLTQPIPPAS